MKVVLSICRIFDTTLSVNRFCLWYKAQIIQIFSEWYATPYPYFSFPNFSFLIHILYWTWILILGSQIVICLWFIRTIKFDDGCEAFLFIVKFLPNLFLCCIYPGQNHLAEPDAENEDAIGCTCQQPGSFCWCPKARLFCIDAKCANFYHWCEHKDHIEQKDYESRYYDIAWWWCVPVIHWGKHPDNQTDCLN